MLSVDLLISAGKQNKSSIPIDLEGAFKLFDYTGFTSIYLCDAVQRKFDLIPTVINQLIDTDNKRGTTIERILSRVSFCVKSINNGKFLDELLERCSDKFVDLWKV